MVSFTTEEKMDHKERGHYGRRAVRWGSIMVSPVMVSRVVRSD